MCVATKELDRVKIHEESSVVRYDTIVVFQCTSVPYAFSDSWGSQHEIDLPVAAPLKCVFQSVSGINFTCIQQIGKATFPDEFGDALRFLSNYFICIKVQNNVMILFLFCFDVLGQINNKLLPWVGWCGCMFVPHIDCFVSPCTVITFILDTPVPSDYWYLGVPLSGKCYFTPPPIPDGSCSDESTLELQVPIADIRVPLVM